MKKSLPKLESFEQLFFELPLYAKSVVSENFSHLTLYGVKREIIFSLGNKQPLRLEKIVTPAVVDGYCVECSRHSTFAVTYPDILPCTERDLINRKAVDQITLSCHRDRTHKISLFFKIEMGIVTKVGQYPSLADITNDASSVYRNSISKMDASEFHKAIGLASHGVGIGSFVYLRRVFERLILKRFNEVKDAEGWDDAEFNSKKMADRIQFLSHHLPEFLVENKSIYSILSAGVHELSDEQCLAYFDVLKASVIFILDEDKRKKEALDNKGILKKALDDIKQDIAK